MFSTNLGFCTLFPKINSAVPILLQTLCKYIFLWCLSFLDQVSKMPVSIETLPARTKMMILRFFEKWDSEKKWSIWSQMTIGNQFFACAAAQNKRTHVFIYMVRSTLLHLRLLGWPSGWKSKVFDKFMYLHTFPKNQFSSSHTSQDIVQIHFLWFLSFLDEVSKMPV